MQPKHRAHAQAPLILPCALLVRNAKALLPRKSVHIALQLPVNLSLGHLGLGTQHIIIEFWVPRCRVTLTTIQLASNVPDR